MRDGPRAVRDDLWTLRDDLWTLRDDLWTMRDDLWTMRDDPRTLRDDLWTMRDARWTVQDDLWTLRDNLWTLRDNLWTLRDNLWTLRDDRWTVRNAIPRPLTHQTTQARQTRRPQSHSRSQTPAQASSPPPKTPLRRGHRFAEAKRRQKLTRTPSQGALPRADPISRNIHAQKEESARETYGFSRIRRACGAGPASPRPTAGPVRPSTPPRHPETHP